MNSPINPGIDLFTLVPIFIGIIFVIVLGTIITRAVKGATQWRKNEKSPQLTTPAIVSGKRTKVSSHGNNDHRRTRTTYYATFEFDSGDRQEFHLSEQDYAQLAEDDLGFLTFKGTRFLGFERSKDHSNSNSQ